MTFRLRCAASAAVIIFCFVSVAMKVAEPTASQMSLFAKALVDALDESQRTKLTLSYDSPQRVQWHFIPKANRKGVPLGDMNDVQRVAALRLVRSALSEAGYSKTQQIMMLETVLQVIEGERPKRKWQRDADRYYVTLFGEPLKNGHWGLSFEGHHLSLNFVCRDGQVVDSTPQFFAANPARMTTAVQSPDGLPVPRKGTRVLREEEAFAFKLIESLDETQLEQAVIAKQAPREIRFAGKPQPQSVTVDGESDSWDAAGQGIAFGALKTNQQKMLKQLVDVYLQTATAEVAQQRLARIDASGWKSVRFAWAGATEPGIGHYYRVEGAGFLIELVNTQPDALGNPANHIHCVLRDLTGDFDLPAL